MARVLIVDDEALILSLAADFVRHMGHEALPCSTGNEAWAKLQAGEEVDLVISDVMMPGMDGRELAKRVMQNPSTKKTPIIMMSGGFNGMQIRKALGEKAKFLPKPMGMNEFCDAVRDALMPKALEAAS